MGINAINENLMPKLAINVRGAQTIMLWIELKKLIKCIREGNFASDSCVSTALNIFNYWQLN